MTRSRLTLLLLAAALLTFFALALLVSIFERRQEARLTHFEIVQIAEDEPDPAVWGRNFPRQYEAYVRTMRTSELIQYSRFGRYGGSEAFSKLDVHPAYRRLFAGYPFSVEYREDRGHMMALKDMWATARLGDAKPGTCMTCKSSNVLRMMKELTPAGFYGTPAKELMARFNPSHPVSCADCHTAGTMALRLTRPAFVEAMTRRGVDLAKATHQEMRTYVCAQCHVEYYFRGPEKYLVFPWDRGLSIDSIEAYYDGIGFKDWTHEETGAALVKIQHPEFELWSSGVHARAGVSCADCHMPYRREGAIKVTDHWIRTPLANLTNACATCHRLPDEELRGRILAAQERTYTLLKRAEEAILAAQDAIAASRRRGASGAALSEAQGWHRRAFIRWDFVSAENSMGFHSPQEAARILADAIDYARQAEIAAQRAAVAATATGSAQ